MKLLQPYHIASPLGVLLLTLTASAAPSLSLDDYLSQVGKEHQGVQASNASKEGAKLRAAEGSVLFSPTAFSTVQLANDSQKNMQVPYSKLITNTYTLGISQQTRFGLQGKLYYRLNYFDYKDVRPPFYEGRPILELSQPLWRNGFGSEVRATENLIQASALASHYGESFKVKATLAEAEAAYWRLALARENMMIQKDALNRAQKIFDWNERRARLQLADRADMLQAEAALQVRRLQLQAALDEHKAASWAFNQNRSVSNSEVAEQLEPLSVDLLSQLQVPTRAPLRDDVQAAREAERIATANAEISIQKDKPIFELFSSAALNSREADISPAFSKSLTLDQPTFAVGVRLSAPLAFGTLSDARAGWRKEQDAAALTYQRKFFEQEQEWKDLNRRFGEAKKRYELTRSIEAAQATKLKYERERLNRGRTTTYQVLQFEQEYALSQFSRMQSQAEILQIAARMKLFRGDQ